jgi:branched-chain amino acid transport system ATP-binding protein
MLSVKDLNVFYGGIHALKGVSIDVQEGQIVSIIGSNGAGKSTLINAISGIVKYKDGEILYKGEKLPKHAHKIVKSGICQVPEGRVIFAFPILKERQNQIAGTLSGGEQQMLAMGRGIMSSPELVLLDEPSLGLAPLLINTIFDIIIEIKKMGKTILLVEQNAFKALSVADKAYVLEQGVVAMEGLASDLIKNEKVQEAYLGKK